VDVRTTYVRLRSENIVQEFDVEKELALRFTYDRWFEFLLGHMITRIALGGEGAPPDAKRFLAEVASVRTIFVFWGAFKNIIVDYLRRIRRRPILGGVSHLRPRRTRRKGGGERPPRPVATFW
jgi:hypothetical protein